MKKKQQNNYSEENWKKVYIYTGDEFLSRMYTFPDCYIEIFDNNTSLNKITSALKGINFFDQPKLVKIYNPNTEQCKTIAEVINNFKLTPDYLQIFCFNDTLDGRSALASKGKASGRIFNYGAIEYGVIYSLNKCIQNWADHHNLEFNFEALKWLETNSPTMTIKVKSGAIKKDVLVYDLPLLFNELNKLTFLENKNIKLLDLQRLDSFNQDINIFDFIKNCLGDNPSSILSGLISLNQSHGHQTVLMIFLYQLLFLLNVAEFKDRGIYNESLILDELSLKNYLNKYLDEDFENIAKDIPAKNINPVRLRISMNELKCDSKSISIKIESVLNAVIDLRNNLSESIVFPYLSLCLANNKKYKSIPYN